MNHKRYYLQNGMLRPVLLLNEHTICPSQVVPFTCPLQQRRFPWRSVNVFVPLGHCVDCLDDLFLNPSWITAASHLTGIIYKSKTATRIPVKAYTIIFIAGAPIPTFGAYF